MATKLKLIDEYVKLVEALRGVGDMDAASRAELKRAKLQTHEQIKAVLGHKETKRQIDALWAPGGILNSNG